MKKPLIKLCGIQSPEMAIFCAKSGADYIGIVLCPTSRRCVTLSQATSIASATHNAGKIPVAIYTTQDSHAIVEASNAIGVNHVQLQGDRARQSLLQLPDSFTIFYATDTQSTLPRGLRPHQDFVLFDASHGGSGHVFDWETIPSNFPYRYFIAGGLNASNVQHALQGRQPHGVDVSSGIESSPGVKSPEKIQLFIQTVHEATND